MKRQAYPAGEVDWWRALGLFGAFVLSLVFWAFVLFVALPVMACAMTAMRTFTPDENYTHYRVLLDVDRYDPDAGRSIQDVYAIGATSAKEIALDILYERGDRAASVLRSRSCAPSATTR